MLKEEINQCKFNPITQDELKPQNMSCPEPCRKFTNSSLAFKRLKNQTLHLRQAKT